MGKLYKYRNFEDEHMEDIIKNASLYFSSIENFNDPFDCKLSFRQSYSKQEIKKYHIEYQKRNSRHNFRLKDISKKFGKNKDFIKIGSDGIKNIISSLGVLSLSSNYKSILMWSHYSSAHTGLVFEFEPINTENEYSCFNHPIKIDYDESYEELSYVNVPREEIPKLLLTKYKDWSYEEEYRCFGLDFQGNKKFEKRELTKIIFGVNAKEENIKKIMQLCKENDFTHTKFEKAKLNHGKFSLSFDDISSSFTVSGAWE